MLYQVVMNLQKDCTATEIPQCITLVQTVKTLASLPMIPAHTKTLLCTVQPTVRTRTRFFLRDRGASLTLKTVRSIPGASSAMTDRSGVSLEKGGEETETVKINIILCLLLKHRVEICFSTTKYMYLKRCAI